MPPHHRHHHNLADSNNRRKKKSNNIRKKNHDDDKPRNNYQEEMSRMCEEGVRLLTTQGTQMIVPGYEQVFLNYVFDQPVILNFLDTINSDYPYYRQMHYTMASEEIFNYFVKEGTLPVDRKTWVRAGRAGRGRPGRAGLLYSTCMYEYVYLYHFLPRGMK